MSKNNDTYQQIEAYLNGELSSTERAAFDHELVSNKDLQEAVELHLLVNDLVLESKFEHLSSLVNKERAKSHTRKNVQKGLVGLGALVIVATAYLGYRNNTENKNNYPSAPLQEKTSATPTTTINQQEKTVETKPKNTLVDSLAKTREATPHKTSVAAQTETIASDTINHVTNKKQVAEATPQPVILEQQVPKAIKEVVDIDPCEGVTISFSAESKAICENNNHGEIKLTSIAGGQAPYLTQIKNDEDELVTNGLLESGTYTVQLSDKNDCKSKLKTIILTKKRCLDDYSISKLYNTSLDLLAFDEAVSLHVFEQNNTIYFEQKYDAYEPIHWNGANRNGQVIEGYYLLIITTESGEKLKGSITILP